jgi:hypothetical protein
VADHLQPGDIWRHPGMGLLYVTDEDRDAYPVYAVTAAQAVTTVLELAGAGAKVLRIARQGDW